MPEIKDKKLLFSIYNEGDPLVNSHCGIPEPYKKSDNLIDPKDLDLVITPLVGFDVDGNRLGMGGGYYDRTFAFTKQHSDDDDHGPCLIGVAYEFQNISQVPTESWDVPLDKLVTEIQRREFTGRNNKG